MLRHALNLALVAMSLSAAAAEGDGTLIEQKPFVLPAYAGLPAPTRAQVRPADYDAMRRDTDVEIVRMTYLSDGLKIRGFILRPRRTGKLPVLIWNHGGIGDNSKIGLENFQTLDEMVRYARAGFVVLASQYRGIDGSEGIDEIAGADTHDVVNLIALARNLAYADATHVFMWGFSRGALMTLQALAQGAPIRAAAVVGPPTDFTDNERRNPALAMTLGASDPTFNTDHEGFVERHSPLRWAEKIQVPLLILQGGVDTATPPVTTLAFVGKLEATGALYELHLYANDDHPVTQNRDDRIRRTIAWFQSPPRLSIATVMQGALERRGLDAALAAYRTLGRSDPDRYDFSERTMNGYGYVLLQTNRLKEALAVFALNAEAHPASPNVWDSLAEAELAVGDKNKAIADYKKSLSLHPTNDNAAVQLRKLGAN